MQLNTKEKLISRDFKYQDLRKSQQESLFALGEKSLLSALKYNPINAMLSLR